MVSNQALLIITNDYEPLFNHYEPLSTPFLAFHFDPRGLPTLEAWAPLLYFTAPVLPLGRGISAPREGKGPVTGRAKDGMVRYPTRKDG